MNTKSTTDIHWNERAESEEDKRLVNIADLAQRTLENDFILPRISKEDRVLEVGCGNGFLTQELRKYASHVDAFDYAENMVKSALDQYGEENNRFFHDNLLAPANVEPPYDKIVCVRVLINLRDLDEQITAIRNMHGLLKPGGMLLLLEGYEEGFTALNELRASSGIEEMKPAAINFYSKIEESIPVLEELFEIESRGHLGMFDFLTRVVYPALEGASAATGYSDFHDRITPIAKVTNPDEFQGLSRMQNFALIKK